RKSPDEDACSAGRRALRVVRRLLHGGFRRAFYWRSLEVESSLLQSFSSRAGDFVLLLLHKTIHFLFSRCPWVLPGHGAARIVDCSARGHAADARFAVLDRDAL